ncbi:unnamed protein product [Cyprideis torosa]|uniref:Uncharacterized protein n=1 Tax=Cyprideis torosa TaxID=163714 RepID=A0A7R8WKH4_9CRUS|nr:unnamed protein product [Cyprideis torosa]CAG0901368.1 unnamed protein product [Cyprideis torosa]
MFGDISELLDHKMEHCKLRFTCKCGVGDEQSGDLATSVEEGLVKLVCILCKKPFASAWDLVVHVQESHEVHLYELKTKNSRQTGGYGHSQAMLIE